MIREKLAAYGSETLTNQELVEYFLGNNALHSDANLILREVAKKTVKELMVMYGLTMATAVSLKAAEEFGRRLFSLNEKSIPNIRFGCPEDIAQYLLPRLSAKPVEEFVVLCLNTKNNLIACQPVSKGSLSSSVVHPREVFNFAIVSRAAALAVAHNHPSGLAVPSKEDVELTMALVRCGKLLGIPLQDHIIIGQGEYYSFREHQAACFE